MKNRNREPKAVRRDHRRFARRTCQRRIWSQGVQGRICKLARVGDFNLQLEVNIPAAGNSGVYLCGIYEIRALDSEGKALAPHTMGALYSRIAPSASAEKRAGEWQTMDLTLVDRHLIVVLSGTTIIDNQPILGCTGGAMWSDESQPGPLYLQGDHGAVRKAHGPEPCRVAGLPRRASPTSQRKTSRKYGTPA